MLCNEKSKAVSGKDGPKKNEVAAALMNDVAGLEIDSLALPSNREMVKATPCKHLNSAISKTLHPNKVDIAHSPNLHRPGKRVKRSRHGNLHLEEGVASTNSSLFHMV